MVARRLLIFSPRSPLLPSGAEVATRALVARLVAGGSEAIWISGGAGPGGAVEGEVPGAGLAHWSRSAPDFSAWISRFRPTAVFGLLGWIRRSAAAARALGTGAVGLVHLPGDLAEARRQAELFDLLAVCSEALVRQADGFRRVVVLHPPLGDPARYLAAPVVRPRAPLRVGLINVLEGKGSRTFHALARRFAPEVARGEIAWFGVRGGYGRQDCEEPAPSGVVYLPPSVPVAGAYAELDLLLVPSLAESFGMVAREASANGIPVLASDLPGLREALGDAGELLPSGDLDGWEQAIRRLLEPEAFARAAARATSRVEAWRQTEELEAEAFGRALEELERTKEPKMRDKPPSPTWREKQTKRAQDLADRRPAPPPFVPGRPRPKSSSPATFSPAPLPPAPPLPPVSRPEITLRRVAVLTRRFWPPEQGGEMALRGLVDDLRALVPGAEVLVCYSVGSEAPAGALGLGVEVRFCPGASPEELVAAASAWSPDLAFAHDAGLWEAAALGLPCRKVALVHYWTGILREPNRAHADRAPVPGAVATLRGFDGVAANSTYTRDLLLGLGVPAERIAVVRPGITEEAVAGGRGAGGEAAGPVVVLGSAKMRPEVLAALRQAFPVRVVAYDRGSGSELLSPGELSSLFAGASCLAHPTFLSESYCRAALEALASGLPVVYSALGNLPRMVGRGAGLPLALEASPAEWVAAVTRAWHGPERERMAPLARRRGSILLDLVSPRRDLSTLLERLSGGRLPGRSTVVAVPNYPGVQVAADHLARVAGVRLAQGTVPQGDAVLLGSFSKAWIDELEAGRRPGRRVGLWWHSDLAQSDFSGEPIWLARVVELLEAGRLDLLLPTARSLFEVLRARGLPAAWLPDVFSDELEPQVDPPAPKTLRIALLSAAGARKNHATALGAAAIAGAEVLAFPSLLARPEIAALVAALRVRVVSKEVPIGDKAGARRLLSEATASVAVSHAETFCYQAAESIAAGAPVLGSGAVPVLARIEGDDGISVLPDPSDCAEIARRLLLLHHEPALRERVLRAQRIALEETALVHSLIADRALEELER